MMAPAGFYNWQWCKSLFRDVVQKVTTSLIHHAHPPLPTFDGVTLCLVPRCDLTVHIPSTLRMPSLTSQSLVRVKYNEHAQTPLPPSDLTVDLSPPTLTSFSRTRSCAPAFKMAGRHLISSLAFAESTDLSIHHGGTITSLMSRLLTPASAPTPSSTGPPPHIPTHRVQRRVEVQARSRTSSRLEGALCLTRELPRSFPGWCYKEGVDNMKVRMAGQTTCVALAFREATCAGLPSRCKYMYSFSQRFRLSAIADLIHEKYPAANI